MDRRWLALFLASAFSLLPCALRAQSAQPLGTRKISQLLNDIGMADGQTACWSVASNKLVACSGGGGGGGTPGGSNTQVQFNNSGAFGGITGVTTNGSSFNATLPLHSSGDSNNPVTHPYTSSNSGLVVKDVNNVEVFRLWASDPDVSDNNNSGNLYLGYQAGLAQLTDQTGGFLNTGIGWNSLKSTTTSANNVAVGANTLFSCVSGGRNTALGDQALYADTSGEDNTAIGHQALGNDGSLSGLGVTTGSQNTVVGSQSMPESTLGIESDNVAVGYRAGELSNGDSQNVYIGSNAGPSTGTGRTNSIAIGYNVKVPSNNVGIFGNNSLTDVYFGSTSGNAILHGVGSSLTGITESQITGLVPLARGGLNYASNTGAAGKIPIGNGSGQFVEGDPLVQGLFADGSTSAANPVAIGGYDTAGTPALHRAIELNSGPAGTEYGLVTRNIPSGTQPVSGTVTANAGSGTFNIQSNASTNVAQISGTTTDTNSGTKSAGTQRVVLATDQPQLTNKLLVTPDSVALPANQSVNVSQFGGSNVVTGTGTGGSGIPRVTVSSDSSLAATQSGNWTSRIVGNAGSAMDVAVGGAAAPANALVEGGVYNNTQPSLTDTNAAAAQLDQAGNQRVFNGVALKTLSAQGTTSGNTQTIFSNSGAQSVLVQLTQTTTLTAGAISYEVTYDNSNWVTIPANDCLDPTSATYAQIGLPYTVQASTNKQFLLLTTGAQGLRIKTTTNITGTGSVTPNYALLNFSPAQTVIALSPTAANFNVTSNGGSSTNQNVNVAQISGATTSTAASGVQKVGVVGNAGATIDSQIAGSIPTNALAVLSQYRHSPFTSDSDGIVYSLQGDLSGNLKVTPALSLDGAFSSWSSGNSINSTQAIFGWGGNNGTTGAPQSIVQLVQSAGTFSAGAITFEVTYDSSNWVAIPADAVLDPTSTSLAQISLPYTLVTSTNKPFLIINRGWEGLRIKLSTAITGSGSVAINAAHLPAPFYVHTDQDYIAGGAIATAATGVQKVGVVGNANVALDAATGGTVPANGLLTSARAATTNPSNATDTKLVGLMADKAGRLVTTTGHVRDLVAVQTTAISASAAETTIVTAGAAGVFNDITMLVITNSGSATCSWTLKDATAGTTRAVFDMPATVGTGSLVIPFNPPLPQSAAANNWTITCSTGTSTGAHITAVYEKNL